MPALEERRTLAQASAGAMLRAASDGERFAGLASPFGVRAPIGDPMTWGFFEEFLPGAYTDTLDGGDQRKLIDHDSYYVVSRVSAGTLALSQSARGLEVDSALDEQLSYVRDLKANLRNGNVTGMSIGFRVMPGGDTWSEIEVESVRPDGKIEVYRAELRTIHAVDLVEVSSVTFPAFPTTEASLRFAVGPALALRHDAAAVARRAEHLPAELRSLLPDIRCAVTPSRQAVAHRMSAHAARWRLPV